MQHHLFEKQTILPNYLYEYFVMCSYHLSLGGVAFHSRYLHYFLPYPLKRNRWFDIVSSHKGFMKYLAIISYLSKDVLLLILNINFKCTIFKIL